MTTSFFNITNKTRENPVLSSQCHYRDRISKLHLDDISKTSCDVSYARGCDDFSSF